MKNITRHHGTVTDMVRLNNSANGNPRFKFVIDGYSVVTSVDSMLGYCIQNMEGKRCIAEIGTHYGVTTLNRIELAGSLMLDKDHKGTHYWTGENA